MIVKFVELTNFSNWGKFMVAKFDASEWAVKSKVDEGKGLISGRGWSPHHFWVLDIQTGEGAMFRPGGSAVADLNAHAIWVCPMFEVFLKWLYDHPEHWEDILTLPGILELTDEETMKATSLYGYRREGPDKKTREALNALVGDP